MKIFERGEQATMSGRGAKMGAEIIPGLLESIRKATSERREYGKGKKAVSATAGRLRHKRSGI